MACAEAAVHAVPGRRPRPADAARVQPRRCGRGPWAMPGRRPLPAGDHGDAAGQLPVGIAVLELAATLGGGAGGGHRGRAAGRRRPRTWQPGLVVLILAPELYLPLRNARRPVPRQHGWAGRRQADARPDRRARRRFRPAARWFRPAGPPPSVRFERVRFAYPAPARPGAVSGFDLELRPGRRWRWWGASGAGSSTVAALLLGLIEPGRRPADGWAASIWPAACRSVGDPQIAWVPQRPTMIRGSVADNIRLGDPAASRPAGARRRRTGRRRTWLDRGPPRTAPGRLIGDGGRQLSSRRAAAGWRWPARCFATRPCWCSTSPPPISIRPAAALVGTMPSTGSRRGLHDPADRAPQASWVERADRVVAIGRAAELPGSEAA